MKSYTELDLLAYIMKNNLTQEREILSILGKKKKNLDTIYELITNLSKKKLLNNKNGTLTVLAKKTEGILSITRNGMVVTSVEGEKILIDGVYGHFVFNDDRVAVLISNRLKTGKNFGIIYDVIERAKTALTVGFKKNKQGVLFTKALSLELQSHHFIVDSNQIVINTNELYYCTIKKYPSLSDDSFEIKVMHPIGNKDDVRTYINQILLEAEVRVDFSPQIEKEAAKIPEKIESNALINREDLRTLAFVTIDGEDARDFDDAVYATINPVGNFLLYVAIADVSHYVKFDEMLDHEAYARGTSIYFPQRVIPMLPEHLSNGICSLNPQVDRLVMHCKMEITPEGVIVNYKINNGVINSQARLSYNQVEDFINDKIEFEPAIAQNLRILELVHQALNKARHVRGAIDFDTVEPLFKISAEGIIDDIVPRIRLNAHKLIEECMLAANVSVADFILNNQAATLFRVHERPTQEKLANLSDYLNSMAVKFEIAADKVSPQDYYKLLQSIKEREDAANIQINILRSMQLAIYTPTNLGHFGLAYDKYLHFTSPIRRYPDLIVHRVCKAIIAGKEAKYLYNLDKMGIDCSFYERKAEELGRKVDGYYKCKYAQAHLNQEFMGVISSVLSFGFFVYIPEKLIDGLVHISQLGSGYFEFDSSSHRLFGKKNGLIYTLGQKLKVKIVGVDFNNLFIDLHLAIDQTKASLISY